MFATDEVAYSLFMTGKGSVFELRSTTLTAEGNPGDWRSLSLAFRREGWHKGGCREHSERFSGRGARTQTCSGGPAEKKSGVRMTNGP